MTLLNSNNSSNQMIKMINNVKLLDVNPNNLIDINDIINEEFSNVLCHIEKQLKTLEVENKTKIVITGTADNYSFNIKTENERISNLIQSIIEESTK